MSGPGESSAGHDPGRDGGVERHPRHVYGLLHRFRHRHLVLLGVLFAFVLALPLVDEGSIAPQLASLMFTFIVVPTVLATGRNARMIWIGILLALPSIVVVLWELTHPAILPPRALAVTHLLSMVGFLSFTVAVMSVHLLKEREVNEELIASAVGVYLLLGFLYAALYRLSWLWLGECISGMDASGPRLPPLSQFVYFSLMTQTTVGFGDMAPVHSFVRALTVSQAVLGQMFLVVFLAELVGVAASRRRR